MGNSALEFSASCFKTRTDENGVVSQVVADQARQDSYRKYVSSVICIILEDFCKTSFEMKYIIDKLQLDLANICIDIYQEQLISEAFVSLSAIINYYQTFSCCQEEQCTQHMRKVVHRPFIKHHISALVPEFVFFYTYIHIRVYILFKSISSSEFSLIWYVGWLFINSVLVAFHI